MKKSTGFLLGIGAGLAAGAAAGMMAPQSSRRTMQRQMDRGMHKLSGAVDQAVDASLLPATGIYTEAGFGRMAFHGIPGGKEITGFAGALLNAGNAAKPLDKPTLKDIGKIKKPVSIQVCVSLACHHCAQLVMSAQRVAWENPLVTAHMIDANLYPELVKQYQIQRVPLTVLNGDQTVPGGKTMAELTTLLAKL